MGRRALAFVALLAFLVMAAGALVAGVFGSDDTVFNSPAELGADGRPLLTAPDLLAYDGVTVTLRASAPGGVFIGTAHPIDVADFVGDSSRIRVTSVTRTGVVAEDEGSEEPVEPATADFWTDSLTGTGVKELTLTRDGSAAQWVIAPVSGVGPTTVSFGVTVHGLFIGALIAFGVGAAVLLACVELLLHRRQEPPAPTSSVADRLAAYVPEVEVVAPPSSGKHKASRSALASVLALSLAGCMFQGQQSPDLARTKVALTRAELPTLFESYDARLATAIKAARPPRYRDGKWRLADRGPALESDLFGTRVGKLTRLGRRSVPKHDGVEVFSGRFDSYPMWALVASKVDREKRVDLFTRASVQSPWLRQAGSALSEDLPEAGRPGKLPAGDEAAAATAAWRDYLQSGTKDDRLTIDGDSKAWRDNIADLGSRAMFTGYQVSVEPGGKSGLSRVVEIADGALAIVALRVTTRLDGRPDLRVAWAPPYAKYRASKKGVLSFADIAVAIVHLPRNGSPTILGSTFSEVAAP